eukprot:6227500-Pyramimonas_sp.AAC.1
MLTPLVVPHHHGRIRPEGLSQNALWGDPVSVVVCPPKRLAQVVDSSFFVTEPQPASGFRVTMSTTK